MWITINGEQVNSSKIRNAVVGPVDISLGTDRYGRETIRSFGHGVKVTMKNGTVYRSGNDSATRNINELKRAGFITVNDNVMLNPDEIKTAFNSAVRIFQYRHYGTDYYANYGNGLVIDTESGDRYSSANETAEANRRTLRAQGMKI